jgi:hypothetical protein
MNGAAAPIVQHAVCHLSAKRRQGEAVFRLLPYAASWLFTHSCGFFLRLDTLGGRLHPAAKNR